MSSVRVIFCNESGCLYQDDQKGCFILEYGGYSSSLSVPCFFCVKKSLDKINIPAMIENISMASDIEIISPHGCDRCFVLSVTELLGLKELFAGARAMLELNSIIQERIYAPVLT
ncbi:hypothetical protein WJR50_11770 [Catalinimonas sp. 4WD22]|uniref:hypothetical protein n=1 Tax=Catalinimonas locisalis TaxID=3133978 RepID=UPI003100E9AD